jgi:hypothetical protein
MPCNVLDNAVKEMYYKGIMSESRMVNPNKLVEFDKSNLELQKAAKDLYGVKSKELPFTIVDEGLKKEITGSTYRRDNMVNVLRAKPNDKFFNELQTNFDLIETETDRLDYEEEIRVSEDMYERSDYDGIQDFEKLLESGEITQFCSR